MSRRPSAVVLGALVALVFRVRQLQHEVLTLTSRVCRLDAALSSSHRDLLNLRSRYQRHVHTYFPTYPEAAARRTGRPEGEL